MRESVSLFIFFFIVCFLSAGCDERGFLSKNRGKIKARYGSLIMVKKEYEERYIILHRNTFPGVLQRIYKCNIRNYSIFLHQGMLFSHFEYAGNDFQADMAKMADPITKDWWKLTDPMQEPLATRKESEWWASMDLLFQSDTSKVSYETAQRKAFVGKLNGNQNKALTTELSRINDDVVQKILDYNVQNLTLYVHDSMINLYLEYVGKDFEADLSQLLKSKKVKTIYENLLTLMEPQPETGHFWEEMEEIFHTD